MQCFSIFPQLIGHLLRQLYNDQIIYLYEIEISIICLCLVIYKVYDNLKVKSLSTESTFI